MIFHHGTECVVNGTRVLYLAHSIRYPAHVVVEEADSIGIVIHAVRADQLKPPPPTEQERAIKAIAVILNYHDPRILVDDAHRIAESLYRSGLRLVEEDA